MNQFNESTFLVSLQSTIDFFTYFSIITKLDTPCSNLYKIPIF